MTTFGSGRSNITLDEVDNFFRIQPQAAPSSNVSRSSSRQSQQSVGVAAFNIGASRREIPQPVSRGYLMNAEGQRVELPMQNENYLPRYLRQNMPELDENYAQIYQEEENTRLLQDLESSRSVRDDESVHIGQRLHDIDIDSVYSEASETSHGIPHHLIPPNSTDVYDRYEFAHEYDEKLPITYHQLEIVRTIESNPVTVIQGSTGSGKTTQVPQYILDYHADRNEHCNIVVTQPRRIAARSIATRVCHERGWDLGTVCGYQVGLDEPKMSEDTRLLYVTTGTLLQKLITAKNMDAFTHVIIDEVHERDQDTDFLLVVVRKMLRTKSPHVKVVLMSATMDSDLFTKYFLVPVAGKLETAPLLNVERKIYKVSEYYLEHLRTLGPLPKIELDNPGISEEAYNIAFNLILEFDNLDAKEQGVSASGFAHTRGSVLVFLPGLFEIETMHQKLNEVQNKHKLTLVPLHSSISIVDQARVFDQPAANHRKVILSTNIAESSITVSDVKYVVDFCLTKHLMADFNTNYTSLQIQWCSKSNSNQRRGRAGRVSQGRAYRMVSQRFWNDHLSEYGVPEMQRCPLPHIVLNVKRLDLGEPKATLALCISPPNLNDIGKTILMLRGIGALRTTTTDTPYDGELTFLGRAIAQLPLDVRLGKLLIMGFVFGVLEECLIIAAALSLQSVFTKPFMKELEAYKNKLLWSAGQFCDSLAILDTYRSWMDNHVTGYFKRSGVNEAMWCKKKFLQIRRLKEVQRLIEDLKRRLERLNIHLPKRDNRPPQSHADAADNRLILKMALCGAFYPNYFVQQPLDEDMINRDLSGHDPFRTVIVSGLPGNQGIIYKDEIEEQFKDCDKLPPLVHFEETKAYVEFASDTVHMTGKVHTGVYMAVKKRILRKMLEIHQFSQEEATKRLNKIQMLAEQEAARYGRLRTHRLTAADPQQSVTLPSGQQSVITVFVTEVICCGHFWVQIATDQNKEQLTSIQGGLNNVPLQNLTRPIKSGLLVAAPYSEPTHPQVLYYRARIIQTPPAGARQNRVQVFFVDFGNEAVVNTAELRQLDDDLQSRPFLAVECYLSEIRPSIVRCPDGEWSEEATRTFKHMVKYQMACESRFYGKIYSTLGKTLHLELVEKTLQREVNLNSELVRLGFAEKCMEQIISRQNHVKRELEQWEVQYGTHDPPVPSDFLSVSVDNIAEGGRRGRKITLRGPTSPVEMAFVSLCNAGHFREVRIDHGSVNQVAIDDDPHDPAARLMVASFVGLSATSTHMVAYNTTILPHIPGLPAIIALLFCPTAELRTDEKKSRFIGAICGLGAEEESNVPIFSDDDMEITFDTKISVTDLSTINGVRMAMNIAIGNEETSISWGAETITKIQASTRELMLSLIKKNRKHIDMLYYRRPYHWNMVAAEDIIPHSMRVDPNQLYQLHNCVALSGKDDDDSDDDTESVMS